MGIPARSSTEVFAPPAPLLVSSGARAAMRYWWLRNEPPNAALEEVVGQHVVRGALAVQVVVDRQRAGVVVAHGQPDRVRAGDVAVLPAVVQLVLLLVEAVHQVAGAAAGQRPGRVLQDAVRRVDRRRRARLVARSDVAVDPPRPVGEGAGLHPVGGVGAPVGERWRGQVDVRLQQAAVRRAVLRQLGALGSGRPARDRPPGPRPPCPRCRRGCRRSGSPRRSPRGGGSRRAACGAAVARAPPAGAFPAGRAAPAAPEAPEALTAHAAPRTAAASTDVRGENSTAHGGPSLMSLADMASRAGVLRECGTGRSFRHPVSQAVR